MPLARIDLAAGKDAPVSSYRRGEEGKLVIWERRGAVRTFFRHLSLTL